MPKQPGEPGFLFEGSSPKEIRAILSDPAVKITLDDLDAAFSMAYPNVDLDADDYEETTVDKAKMTHVRTITLIEQRRIRLQAEQAVAERTADIDFARAYLAEQGFDHTVLSEPDLYAIATSFHATAAPDSEVEMEVGAVVLDEETGAYRTADGIIVGYKTANDQSVEETLKLAGERLAWVVGRLAAIEAEKAAWQAKINDAYDSRANKLRRHVEWLKATYQPLAWSHIAARNRATGKNERSMQVGLLKIQLGKTSKRVDVSDDGKVIEFLRALEADPANNLPPGWAEAFVNRKETVAKSAFDDGAKAFLTQVGVEGLTFVPGGEDVCQIK